MEWFIIYFDGIPSAISQAPSVEKLEEQMRINALGKEIPPHEIKSIFDAPRDDVILVAILGLVDTVGRGMQEAMLASKMKGGQKRTH